MVGAGIFGITTAIELRQLGFQVALLNPGTVPNPLAASTDISKAVRMEYGADVEYIKMAAYCMDRWMDWNVQFDTQLYHEVGFLLLTRGLLDSPEYSFERNCWENLRSLGYHSERLTQQQIAESFQVFNSQYYIDGIFHARGGYAEASKTVKVLCDYAKSLGVVLYQQEAATNILTGNSKITGVFTQSGMKLNTAQVIICAGNFTPYLLPELKPYFKITGHPVFHIKPSKPAKYMAPQCPVFGADISNTGWYGFPYHPTEQVMKFGKHTSGIELDPNNQPREIQESEKQDFRNFLKQSLPELAEEPIVFTRRCCYTDTLDGHYWIDRHPEIQGLTVGSGGSGHGFKMAPIIGKMIADVTLTGSHDWSDRYGWRILGSETVQAEEARHKSL